MVWNAWAPRALQGRAAEAKRLLPSHPRTARRPRRPSEREALQGSERRPPSHQPYTGGALTAKGLPWEI